MLYEKESLNMRKHSGSLILLMNCPLCVPLCHSVIDEPDEADVCQARAFGYLQQYIGNMRNEEVRHFLRFTTRSSILIANCISVTFQ